MSHKYKSYVTNDIKLIQANKVVDWETVIEICMNNKIFFNKILKTFIDDLELKIKKFNKSSRLEELHLLIHSIKGTSATFGFNLLSCCCNYYILECKKEHCDIDIIKLTFTNSINEIKKEILEDIQQNLDSMFK